MSENGFPVKAKDLEQDEIEEMEQLLLDFGARRNYSMGDLCFCVMSTMTKISFFHGMDSIYNPENDETEFVDDEDEDIEEEPSIM
jgi:hypothetical protein